MNDSRGVARLYSLPALITIAAAAFACNDLLPALGLTGAAPYVLFASLEAIQILQVMAAWRERLNRLPLTHLYILTAIFFLRVVFRLLDGGGVLWALRASSVHTLDLGSIGAMTSIALHPSVYDGAERLSSRLAQGASLYRNVVFLCFLAAFALVCFHFRSYHITRDGFDWIERTTQPVWHLYMREPLTIGLYRWAFLLVWPRWEITSFQTIGILSVAAGVWWAVWMGALFEKKWTDGFDRLLAWMLTLSSGGLVVLFFAHIEVYPIYIAGLAPVLYYCVRYLQGQGGMLPIAVCYSAAFLLHLSAGWLFPAIALLPFFKEDRTSWIGECARFIGVFALIQVCFWGCLIVFYYNAGFSSFASRLHETFFVGPDRAMFLPQWVWFHPRHLFDLGNVYLYYSIPCFLLAPVCLIRISSCRTRETAFWFAMAASYFLYTFFWNPDRGYPEDWDLFSPFTVLIVILTLHLLLPLSAQKNSTSSDSTGIQRSLIYITAAGFFVFSCAQIYFHHIVPFIPPSYR